MNPIEAFLGYQDPHRVVYPGHPLPFPSLVYSGSARLENFERLYEQLMPEVYQILNQHRIVPTEISALQRWREKEDNKKMILCINVECQDSSQLPLAARAIHDLYRSRKSEEFQVEIHNRLQCSCPAYFADDLPSDFNVPWESIMKQLFPVLHVMQGYGLAVMLRMCGFAHRRDPDPRPKAVFYFQEGYVDDWEKTYQRCEAIIKPYKLEFLFRPAVAFVQSATGTKCDKTNEMQYWEYSPEVENGSSIGLKDGDTTGTLGTVIEVLPQDTVNPTNSDDGLYGLTCHHVLAPSAKDLAHCVYRGDCNEERFHASYLTLLHNSIQYPSASDFAEPTNKYVQQEDIGQVTRLGGIRTGCGKCCHESHIDDDTSLLPDGTVHREPYGKRGSPCNVGSIECPNDHTIFDYALFKIKVKAPFVNKAPRLLEGPVTEIGELKPGDQVFKAGRTTNDTKGKICATRLLVFRRDVFEYNGQRHLELTWGYCHAVERIRKHDPPFAAPGDSGGSLIDWANRLVGMLHSGIVDGTETTTFVTPMTSIVKDIKALWGYEIRLPSGEIWPTPSTV